MMRREKLNKAQAAFDKKRAAAAEAAITEENGDESNNEGDAFLENHIPTTSTETDFTYQTESI